MQVGQDRSFNPKAMKNSAGKKPEEHPGKQLRGQGRGREKRADRAQDEVDIRNKGPRGKPRPPRGEPKPPQSEPNGQAGDDVQELIARAEATRMDLVKSVREARYSKSQPTEPSKPEEVKREDPFKNLGGVVKFFSNDDTADVLHRAIDHGRLFEASPKFLGYQD